MPTIFIVDPDPNTPDPLAGRLRHKGYHVLCLRDPEEAADCMRSVRADLLVVDLRGTTMSRPAVMASLRTRRAYQAMPVIVVGRGFAEARCIHASGGSPATGPDATADDLLERVRQIVTPCRRRTSHLGSPATASL